MDGFFIGLVVGLIVISMLAYAAVALFFPEWVGIQGKTAKKIEESHRQDTDSTNS